LAIAQNPLHTFPRNFPVDGEATNLLRPVHTGDYSRPIRRLSPKPATVAEFGDCCRIRRQSPFSATNCRRNRRL